MRYTGKLDATQDRNASKYKVLAEKILLGYIGSTKSWLNKPFSTHRIKEIGDAFGTVELAVEPLTNGQFSLPMSLARDKPVSIGDLAPSLGMDRTTLTAYLKPLERRELVEVVANPEDARSRLPVLTDNGRKLFARAIPLWEQVQQEAVDLLQGHKLDAFKIGLKSLAEIGSETT